MMISTRGRYALRVMIELAERCDEGFVSLKSVSNNQQISEKYMESIISLLVKNGFVEGVRGKGGGYKLTRSAHEYTVGSILTATEGSLAPVACLEKSDGDCQRSCECKTLPIWQNLDKIINDYLESVKLSDLCE
ncbi:MAG: Rrf2 family transcriptional regulator [Clostridia bacterium]|nr:Rrf2 family transcriptional regulator [Clostridia bacterium]